MVRNIKRKLGGCLIGFLAACTAAQPIGQARAGETAANAARPATSAARPVLAGADITKSVEIEPPALAMIQRKSTAPATLGKAFVNAHVQPGLVHWHATFADACRASEKSHKPVLLFHMMGKLDDLFC